MASGVLRDDGQSAYNHSSSDNAECRVERDREREGGREGERERMDEREKGEEGERG